MLTMVTWALIIPSNHMQKLQCRSLKSNLSVNVINIDTFCQTLKHPTATPLRARLRLWLSMAQFSHLLQEFNYDSLLQNKFE